MLKEQYKITTMGGKKPVYGYITAKDGLCFGIHKTKNAWVITELSTGLRIPYDYRTRKEALSAIDGLMGKIKEALSQKVG